MLNTITDDVIKEIEASAAACGQGWYETIGDTADLFPDQDSDTVYVHLLRPELALQLIQRLRNAERRLLSLAMETIGPDRQKAVSEAQRALAHMRRAQGWEGAA